jgi:hypothetical protein
VLEGDEARSAGLVQGFAQPFICLLGLLVAVGADQPVEYLPTGQGQVLSILLEHLGYLGQ